VPAVVLTGREREDRDDDVTAHPDQEIPEMACVRRVTLWRRPTWDVFAATSPNVLITCTNATGHLRRRAARRKNGERRLRKSSF
jgi:hypothetical protein